MIRRLSLLAALYLLVPAGVAAAHPLGNFTINRFARVEVAGDTVYVRYVVDMAEIPTLQRVPAALRRAERHRRRPPAPLRVVARRRAPARRRGLRTTPLPGDPRRPADRAAPRGSTSPTAPTRGGSAGRRSSSARPRVRVERVAGVSDGSASRARSTSRAGGAASSRRTTSRRHSSARRRRGDDRSVRVARRAGRPIAARHPRVARAALFWGAAHALSPGHGKTIVTAYLVGSRGTPAHAALLGLITTVTHTAGVFALGGATLLLSQWIVPERLYPWMTSSRV